MLDAVPEAIPQTNFTGNLYQAGNIFHYWSCILDFLQGTVRVLQMCSIDYFALI